MREQGIADVNSDFLSQILLFSNSYLDFRVFRTKAFFFVYIPTKNLLH